MEKVIHCLHRPERVDGDDLRDQLLGLVPDLVAAGGRGIEVHVADSAVDPAVDHRISTGAMVLPDALVSGWLDSANGPLRASYDAVLAKVDADWFGWVVSESVPLTGPAPGRADGYTQLAFLSRPSTMSTDDWLAHWNDEHTRIAIETQATTRYVQNLVVRPLTAATLGCTAIVEECFPTAAMTDPAVFFDAVGDPERQQANVERLMASVAGFLDFSAIDVVPMSRHVPESTC